MKASRTKVPEAKFSMITAIAMNTTLLWKSGKWGNLASIKMFEEAIWVRVVNGQGANI